MSINVFMLYSVISCETERVPVYFNANQALCDKFKALIGVSQPGLGGDTTRLNSSICAWRGAIAVILGGGASNARAK
jgi:hypothetical protein